ncbi:MAG: hypothetical protein DMG41_13525 [Acidobacteria bacterium]|nr:MAG: hypothetical protein AUH13_25235 [Acidobacteria bacterium 13_2_20CM_58_27]PYT78009.1 MAG: hypothetical protein DMG42_01535 [Acidobacteriota bacterium]PYT87800.1 MAG: hypothetical protein DMG41_13525 [Acidobacteriota bacterium]
MQGAGGASPHLAWWTHMASAILAVAVLGLLIGVTVVLRWRLLGMEFRRRDLRRVGVVPRQTNRVRPYAAHVFGQQSLPLFGSPRNNASAFAPLISKEQRAEAFLERILALTGAKKVDGSYVLNVATVQFQVRDRFIRRLQNPNDPKSPYEETCFYLVHNGMPKVEEIATALLHLSNNPALFDKWALQNGVAFKADGKVFDRCPLLGLR